MAPCEHMNFRADVNVGRLQRSDDDKTIVGYTADVEIKCVECGVKMEFVGLPMGYSPYRPMCSVDGTEARLPIKPVGEAMAMGLPEFSVRVAE